MVLRKAFDDVLLTINSTNSSAKDQLNEVIKLAQSVKYKHCNNSCDVNDLMDSIILLQSSLIDSYDRYEKAMVTTFNKINSDFQVSEGKEISEAVFIANQASSTKAAKLAIDNNALRSEEITAAVFIANKTSIEKAAKLAIENRVLFSTIAKDATYSLTDAEILIAEKELLNIAAMFATEKFNNNNVKQNEEKKIDSIIALEVNDEASSRDDKAVVLAVLSRKLKRACIRTYIRLAVEIGCGLPKNNEVDVDGGAAVESDDRALRLAIDACALKEAAINISMELAVETDIFRNALAMNTADEDSNKGSLRLAIEANLLKEACISTARSIAIETDIAKAAAVKEANELSSKIALDLAEETEYRKAMAMNAADLLVTETIVMREMAVSRANQSSEERATLIANETLILQLVAQRDSVSALLEAKKQAGERRKGFVRYLFHELRTPFNSISLAIELLELEKDALSPDGCDILNMLARSTRAMKTIIDDTLDNAKMENGTFDVNCTPSNLRKCVSDTISNMMHFTDDCKIRITTDISPQLSDHLYFDEGRIQQVLANLISNAKKFAPHDGSGRLTVCVSADFDSNDICIDGALWKDELSCMQFNDSGDEPMGVDAFLSTISINPPSITTKQFEHMSKSRFDFIYTGDNTVTSPRTVDITYCTVVLSICDNGPGLTVDEVHLLFRPMQQLQAGRLSSTTCTGLGLAICRAIVESHGGRVGVRSSGVAGEGLEVLIALRLPVLVESRPKTPSRSITPSCSVSRSLDKLLTTRILRVLVVDDVASNRKLLQKSMQRQLQLWKESIASIVLDSDFDFEVHTADDGHFAVAAALGVTAEQVLLSSSVGVLPAGTTTLDNYDVITIDGQMPLMSGYAATVMIRAAGYTGLILGCTGNALEEDVTLFLTSGADEVFIKPIAVDAIMKLVSQRYSDWALRVTREAE